MFGDDEGRNFENGGVEVFQPIAAGRAGIHREVNDFLDRGLAEVDLEEFVIGWQELRREVEMDADLKDGKGGSLGRVDNRMSDRVPSSW